MTRTTNPFDWTGTATPTIRPLLMQTNQTLSTTPLESCEQTFASISNKIQYASMHAQQPSPPVHPPQSTSRSMKIDKCCQHTRINYDPLVTANNTCVIIMWNVNACACLYLHSCVYICNGMLLDGNVNKSEHALQNWTDLVVVRIANVPRGFHNNLRKHKFNHQPT